MSLAHRTTWYAGILEDVDKHEEKETVTVEDKDVVYKIIYKNPKDINPHKGKSEFYVPYNDEIKEIKIVRLATKDKLIKMLGSKTGHIDISFVSIYLSTYRSFTTPQVLVENILRNFYNYSMKPATEKHSKTNYLKSLITVIYLWTTKYRLDFYDPPNHNILSYLHSFFTTICVCKKLADPLTLMLKEFKNTPYNGITFRGFKWKNKLTNNEFYQLDQLSPWEFAEQLTCIEAELFCHVFPPQCLSSVWSKRAKYPEKVQTVKATIDQFNHLTYRVISMILTPETPKERAKEIEKWIDIAKELNYLKNFSSLKALTSALKSTSIFRLKKTWDLVDQKHLSTFDKLTHTTSDDDNQIVLRDIMIKEETTKFATLKKHRKIKRSHGHQTDDLNYLNLGIVPYLGTFLFDLTMIDSAGSDVVTSPEFEPMVNFEKKRKEHSVLAHLSMLQVSCRLYNLNYHPEFYPAFMNLSSLTESESYKLSCALEPKELGCYRNNNASCNTIEQNTCSSNSFIPGFMETYQKTFCNPFDDFDYAVSDCWIFNSLQNKPLKNITKRKMSTLSAIVDKKLMDGRLMNECIAKVYIEGVAGAAYGSKYKSILVHKRDMTKNIISQTLNKYNVSCDLTAFHLFQILPNQPEILFEENTRVLKNIQPCLSLEFLVKKKHHYVPTTYL